MPYEDTQQQGVLSTEFHGLSTIDILGLTPSAQLSLAKWRLAYSPSMYLKAAEQGFKWPGTFFFGTGGLARGAMESLAGEGTGARNRFFRGAGAFFGGGTGNWAKVDRRARWAMKGNNVFTRSGYEAYKNAAVYAYTRTEMRKIPAQHVMDFVNVSRQKRPIPGTGLSSNTSLILRNNRGMAGPELNAFNFEKTFRSTVIQGEQFASRQFLKYAAFKGLGAVSTALTAMLWFDLAKGAVFGGVLAGNAIASKLSTTKLLDMGSDNFRMASTSGATTERQRALRAIQSSNMNARRFIGNEAAMMHQ